MKETREEVIEYNGNSYRIHPAGSGNPEEDRITELICESIPEADSVALIECGTGIVAAEFKKPIVAFHSNWIDCEYAKINAPESDHRFEDFAITECDTTFDIVMFRITKSVAHNLRIIAKALALLNENGRVLVAGGNKEGIKGVQSKLKKAGVVTDVFANGGGGRILEIEKSETLDIPEELLDTTYQLAGKDLTVTTQEGLFSYGKVDRGSQQILNYVPTMKKRRVLDLGCGSGVLALAALNRGADSVVATDVSAMAVNAAKINLPETENVEVLPSYIGDVFEERFDIILTNPPFHEGKGTTNNLGEEWLDNCQNLLAGNGTLYLVANQFLSYHRWGRERFDVVEELAREEGFVVYAMKSPKRK